MERFLDLIVQIVLGLAAIIVAIVLYLRERERKSLRYEILSSSRLLRTREHLPGVLEILFNKSPVADPYLTVVRISNTGNKEIVSADYERPIKIVVREAEVLAATVDKTNPKDLQPSITLVDGNEVQIEPVLLNSSDSMRISFLTDRRPVTSLTGRIAGVKDIKDVSVYQPPRTVDKPWHKPVKVIIVVVGVFLVLRFPDAVAAFFDSLLRR